MELLLGSACVCISVSIGLVIKAKANVKQTQAQLNNLRERMKNESVR